MICTVYTIGAVQRSSKKRGLFPFWAGRGGTVPLGGGLSPSGPVGFFRRERDAFAVACEGRAPPSLVLEVLLYAERLLAGRWPLALVGPVGAEAAGLDVVAEHRAKRVEHAGLVARIVHREHQLHSLV